MTHPLDPGFTVEELRDAMSLYNLPGVSDMQSIEDFRGDGIDGDGLEAGGHAGNAAAFGLDDFDEDDPMWDGLGADDLIALGWDPFKAVKKTVKAASKLTSKIANPLAKVVGRVPVVGKVLATGVRAGAQLANPLSFLQPRAVLKTQLDAAKAALPVAKMLAKSPVVKAVVGGAAIVFPPIGVPAAAALAAAAAVANAVDSPKAGVKQAALRIVQNTTKLARQGDKGAQIALSQIATQKQALTAKRLASPAPNARRVVHDVYPGGRISRIAL